MICADDAVNYAKPTLSNALVGNKSPEQIPLGDAQKMATQLNMQIETFTWVKKFILSSMNCSLKRSAVPKAEIFQADSGRWG